MKFTLVKVSECTGERGGETLPPGTSRKLLWIEVETSNAYDASTLPASRFTQFTAINPTGVTKGAINPTTPGPCAAKADRVGFTGEPWAQGRKYSGAVEVFLPDTATKVVNAEGYWQWAVQ
ncbi:hypothetical protein [Actinosynnema sp. NPDC020468]|uniref:hypothetical protein n=1 Tax=Actinosynnema sp. NPDC020468 TaxID=3154488 RepID=UPI0033F4592A